uniref:Plastid lipid-associated protein/fibrillin conserved domain-containing protein n=1 Tax=Alexandrium monilatum TaxID=311494 RepID=A0A7S4RFE6_9DINO
MAPLMAAAPPSTAAARAQAAARTNVRSPAGRPAGVGLARAGVAAARGRPAGVFTTSLAAAVALAAAARRRQSHAQRPRALRAAVALRASKAATTALQSETVPEEEDLRAIFAEASGGKDITTFDEAIRLEGVDGVLEEGAVSLKELQLLWGDESVALGFEAWSKWYVQVLALYDEFLWKDAVAPPSDLLADLDEDDEEDEDYEDEDLLVDAPSRYQDISKLLKQREQAQAEERGQLPAASTPALAAPATTEEGRENFEITRLFREGCDDQNMLSFEALLEISDIKAMLVQEEVTKTELKEMWAELPSKDGNIDVLTFKDLMGKVDDLFEYEEEELEEELDLAPAPLEEIAEVGAEAEVAPKLRAPAIVKSELQAMIQNLEEVETRPCGLDGRPETDTAITKLTDELEQIWRDKLEDVADFDETELVGDWELVYSTSAKYRRWQSVLNSDKYIKGGIVDALVQTFSIEPSTGAKEYDMEEVFLLEGQEQGMRSEGSWSVGLQSNVVTGDDDLVLKIGLNGVEYDNQEEEIEQAEKKLLSSQMIRTFCYSFIAYVDDDVRVMRTGLSGNSVFIYQRMQDKDD